MKRVQFLLIFILCGMLCVSQEKENEPNDPIEEQIENQAESSETEIEDDSYLRDLAYHSRHPLNVNSADASELRTLRLLSDLQIYQLVLYRNLLGPFIHEYELQAIPSLDIATIRKVIPYITVTDTRNIHHHLGKRLIGGDENLMFRYSMIVPKSKGFIKNDSAGTRYLGSRPHVLIRYHYNFKNILQYGLLGDKDAGEQFFKGTQKRGFDFYSFHFYTRKLGIIKSLALGDFTVNLGQGLIQWQSFGFKKSTSVVSVKRQSEVLQPYASAGEMNFNRGAGITLVKGNWETTFFGSFRKLSAIIDNDSSLNRTGNISSFINSGYHRTIQELEHRNNVSLVSLGSNIKYNYSGWNLAVSMSRYFFSDSLKPSGKPYDQFAINGKNWSNYSLDYGYTFRNIHSFGEIAADRSRNIGLVSGVIASIDRSVDLAFVYRNIAKRFQSLYGNAFTENNLPGNEEGIYIATTIRPSTQLKMDAYVDFFKFPWLSFRTDAPGYGSEFMFQLTFIRGKQVEINIRYKKESKQINQPTGLSTTPVELVPRHNLRYHLTYRFERGFVLKTRVEATWYNTKWASAEKGYLTYIDLHYKHPIKPFSGYSRILYFETGGYQSRLYAYENDLMFSFNSPVFFDKGFRWYLNLRTNVSKWIFSRSFVSIVAELKYALTHYFKLDKIGSELNEIQGNLRSELKFQLLISR